MPDAQLAPLITKTTILIEIVERYLPQGLEAWNAVFLQYQRESNELHLRRGEDLRDNWNKKLCNRMQKPTGKPGANTDRIFRCIAIERRIQDEAAAAILGADLAESAHSRDDGDSALSDVVRRMVSGLVLMRRMKRWWL